MTAKQNIESSYYISLKVNGLIIILNCYFLSYSLAHSASSSVLTEYITLLSSSFMQLVSCIGQEAATS